ncbi:indole-3-glycerol phosphate synthase TrpC [Staphylococcus caprae]|uniref:indole-3-glycerol phosphate synthase TrpC n=1 Tax=Staphylococcus caprae TaxID=29380 RepID=UPI001F589BED|nr:indole-3-glycerol phosphate synthase TrpC [Staphylococcus caprae]MCI2953780.1 indole-3-glycerol phosphate synthase TrpC [Staphylococcus caprae]
MTILNEIVEYKKELLNKGYYKHKLDELKQVDVTNKTKLIDALKNDKNLSIIAEIKSKSPTLNQLPERNLHTQVREYELYGANAISILTDEKYFGGSFERLTELTIETKLPVLCKDFIIDKIQIDVAKKAGASIILLIVNILSDTELKELYDYATQLGLEVLVEVHDQDELKKAYQLSPEIIGVNNRDLKQFVTKVEHTNEILKAKRRGFHYISESGIHSINDVKTILNSGIDGLLIGEALMKCEDLSQFLPSLKLEKVRQ